jgi:hypothetical protein
MYAIFHDVAAMIMLRRKAIPVANYFVPLEEGPTHKSRKLRG